MVFTENRLDLGYDFGTVGGPQFNTTIVVTGGGNEQRNSNWSEARGRWQIGDRLYDRAELDSIINFFRAVKGSAIGFRFKDWSDYSATKQLIGVGNGSLTQFQLKKTYSVGALTSDRTIKKPVPGTVLVYVANVPTIAGVSVDATTGIVTFTSPPTGNVAASFEFDVPVRFEQDRFDHRYDGGTDDNALFYVSSLSVVEIRV